MEGRGTGGGEAEGGEGRQSAEEGSDMEVDKHECGSGEGEEEDMGGVETTPSTDGLAGEGGEQEGGAAASSDMRRGRQQRAHGGMAGQAGHTAHTGRAARG